MQSGFRDDFFRRAQRPVPPAQRPALLEWGKNAKSFAMPFACLILTPDSFFLMPSAQSLVPSCNGCPLSAAICLLTSDLLGAPKPSGEGG